MHEGHSDMVAAVFSAKAGSQKSLGWGCDMLRWVRQSDKDGGTPSPASPASPVEANASLAS